MKDAPDAAAPQVLDLAGMWELSDETGEWTCPMRVPDGLGPGRPARLAFRSADPGAHPHSTLRDLRSAPHSRQA